MHVSTLQAAEKEYLRQSAVSTFADVVGIRDKFLDVCLSDERCRKRLVNRVRDTPGISLDEDGDLLSIPIRVKTARKCVPCRPCLRLPSHCEVHGAGAQAALLHTVAGVKNCWLSTPIIFYPESLNCYVRPTRIIVAIAIAMSPLMIAALRCCAVHTCTAFTSPRLWVRTRSDVSECAQAVGGSLMRHLCDRSVWSMCSHACLLNQVGRVHACTSTPYTCLSMLEHALTGSLRACMTCTLPAHVSKYGVAVSSCHLSMCTCIRGV